MWDIGFLFVFEPVVVILPDDVEFRAHFTVRCICWNFSGWLSDKRNIDGHSGHLTCVSLQNKEFTMLWSTSLFEKLIVPHRKKKKLCIVWNTTVQCRVHKISPQEPYWANWIQSISPYALSLKLIVRVSYLLCLGPTSGFFHVFRLKCCITNKLHVSCMHSKSHLSWCDHSDTWGYHCFKHHISFHCYFFVGYSLNWLLFYLII